MSDTSPTTAEGKLQALWQEANRLRQAGELSRAAEAYDRLLHLLPKSADLLDQRGIVALSLGDYVKAESCFHRALLVDSSRASSQRQLGIALRQQGKLKRALVHLRQAADLDPDSALGQTLLGAALNASGNALEAIAAHRVAIALDAHFSGAWNNLGLALETAGEYEQAKTAFERAVSLQPGTIDFIHNLGNAQLRLRNFAEAEAHFQAVLQRNPAHVKALIDLGSLHKARGQLEAAEQFFHRAIEREPSSATAHWNLGLIHLLNEDFKRGWPQYEWRRKIPEMKIRYGEEKAWLGDPLGSRTLLLHCEQGLGDAIQFIRYVRRVDKQEGRLVVECPPRLCRLFEGIAEIDQLLPRGGSPPPFTCQAPLMSLPYLLRLRKAELASPSPYLAAEPDRVAHWRTRLAAGTRDDAETHTRPRIGICWQGSTSYAADAERSIAPHHFGRLAQFADVHWVSLQQSETGDPRPGLDGLRDFGSELDRGDDAFVDTAALIPLMDLIICSDTAIPHLAGAMGVETWLLLAQQPDWRWGRHGETSPWYPGMRLFRQHEAGNWQQVIDRVSAALKERLR